MKRFNKGTFGCMNVFLAAVAFACSTASGSMQEHAITEGNEGANTVVSNGNYCYPDIPQSEIETLMEIVKNSVRINYSDPSDLSRDEAQQSVVEKIIELVENSKTPHKAHLAQAIHAEIMINAHRQDFERMRADYETTNADLKLQELQNEYLSHIEDYKKINELLSTPPDRISTTWPTQYEIERTASVNQWRSDYRRELSSRDINDIGLKGINQVLDRIIQSNGRIIDHVRASEISLDSQELIISRLRSLTSFALIQKNHQVELNHARYQQNLALAQLALDIGTTLIPGAIFAKVLGKAVVAAHGVRGTNTARTLASASQTAQRSRGAILSSRAVKTARRMSIGAATWAGGGFVFGNGVHVLHNIIDSYATPEGFFCEYARLTAEAGTAAESGFAAARDASWKGALASINPLTLLGVASYEAGSTVYDIATQIDRVQETLETAEQYRASGNTEVAELYYDRATRDIAKLSIEPLSELLPFTSRGVRQTARENIQQNIQTAKQILSSLGNRLRQRNPTDNIDMSELNSLSHSQHEAVSVSAVQEMLETAEANGSVRRMIFVKDQPIVAYRIEDGDTFDSLPQPIQDGLRTTVDGVDYSDHGGYDAYLAENSGSIISLQTKNDGTLDFYIVGKNSSDYNLVSIDEVAAKNNQNLEALRTNPTMAAELSSNPRITGALRMAPVEMIRASDLGINPEAEFTLDKYGGQTKPAGSDAFFVVRDGEVKYLINVDENAGGNPIAYTPSN